MSQNVNFCYRLAAFGAAFSVILSVGWFYFPANKSSLEHISQNIPKYWTVCVWQWNQNGNLRTMNRVFERLGYEFVNASNGDDWDVLWGIEFPFYEEASQLYDPIWPTLKPHQRINHIPGMNYLTSKAYMTTENADLKFILPSFVDSDKFKDYVATHPDKKFIEKNFANRGVQIIDAKNLDFKADLIYQEFMEKPFLIDERTFDLGVFVLITSIDPLRVYRFKNEILLRFCPEPYYPFDETNEDKFVIQESNIHYLQMPSLKRYCEKYGFSGKMAFEDYLLKQGHSVEKLWTDIDEAITILIARNERFFIKYTFETYNFTSSHNFFELLRFDFIIDEDLNVFLMEANMSPNLTPSYEKFEGNALTNEQVVHDTLKLIGAGSYMELMSIYNQKSDEMISNFKNTAVDPASCVDNECYKSCETAACRLCTTCLSLKEQQSLHHAYREHIRRGEFKRIFPSEVHFEPTAMAKMSTQNEISAHWFKAKCKESKDWC